MKSELRTAYINTTYRIYVPEGFVDVRISLPTPGLQRILRLHKTHTWAVLTACNPSSKRLPNNKNLSLSVLLERHIQRLNLPCYRAAGIPDSSDWESESSIFVCDLSMKMAFCIANRFNQNAFVFGRTYRRSDLIWVR